jgi:hypothetical protein
MNFIKKYFQKQREKKARIQSKVESVINDYEKLIEQYRAVQERRSGLSRKDREFVEMRVKYLVSKGHLTINK